MRAEHERERDRDVDGARYLVEALNPRLWRVDFTPLLTGSYKAFFDSEPETRLPKRLIFL